MASITIRKLDEQTKARLRVRAAHRKRSMEDEARNILRVALADEAAVPHNLAEAIQRRFRPLGGVELSLPVREPMREPPLGKLEVVSDFLPGPEDLVFRDEGVKVTLALSKRSVEFFKNQAEKHNTQYQRMIRRLLDAYAEHHSRTPAAGSKRTHKRAA